MINAIAPHGPPVQTGGPVCPATTGTGGDAGGGAAFDDFLSGKPSTGVPSPIDDHSPPPPLLDGEPSTEPVEPVLHRPMRWKGSKGPATDPVAEDAASTAVALMSPVDLRAMVPAMTLSPSLSPLTAPVDNDDAPITEAGAGQGTSRPNTTVPLAGAGGAPMAGLPAIPDSIPIFDGSVVSSMTTKALSPLRGRADASMTAEPLVAGEAPPTIGHGLPQTKATADADAASALPIGPGVPVETDVANTDLTPVLSAETAIFTPRQIPRMEGASPVSDPTVVPTPPDASDVGGPSVVGPISVDAAREIILPVVVPTPADASGAGGSPTTAIHPLRNSPFNLSAVKTASSSRLGDAADPTSNPRAEISAALVQDKAKIAEPAARMTMPTHSLEKFELQTSKNERVISEGSISGTPVARDETVVTAAPPTNEKETDASPLPKRANALFSNSTVANRATGSRFQTGGELVGTALTGVTAVSTSTASVADTAAPEPAAARPVVNVETLLQNALSTGQGIRPNGTGQMEMRVRLNGGDQDVTVRMQVANDRMQVTFQTDSPEMRKALEHGWQQFSAGASQTSTLALAQPRFEANTAVQNGQTDTASFSSGQQNSPRQDTLGSGFADELGTTGLPRQTDSAAVATTPRPTATRGWNRWA